MSTRDYSRREFIQTLMAGVALGSVMMSMQRCSSRGIPTRPLGKTGIHVPILCIGGWDAAANKSDEEGVKLLLEALDQGATFWDNAWEYHNGRAEEVMGKALAQSGRREDIFLMTKVCARDYEGARRHLEDSLRRLQTDHLDLWQFHAIQYEGDSGRIFDPEKGALRAALEAREQGKIRFIGFTGHRDPAIHLEMLGRPFEWDSVMIPTNIMDAHYNSFQSQVLPVLNQRNMGVIGMKSLAAQEGRIPKDLNVSAELCRRYALSLPITSLCAGIQTLEELHADLNIVKNFNPLTEEEIDHLLDISEGPAQDGHIEEYKNPKGFFGCSYHTRVLADEANQADAAVNPG